MKAMRLLCGLLMSVLTCSGQDPEQLQIVKVAGGFQSADGPLWHPDGYLLVSDPPAGQIKKLKAGLAPEVALKLSAAGMALDNRKRVIICDPKQRQVLRWDGKGQPEVLASQFEGKKLNSPNDVVT